MRPDIRLTTERNSKREKEKEDTIMGMFDQIKEAMKMRSEAKRIQNEIAKITAEYSNGGITCVARGDMSIVSLSFAEGAYDEVKNGKPRFASLKKGQSVFSITLNEALELFKTALPITLGEIDGKEVIVGEGKFGPYVRHNKSFVSIPKGTDPLTLTLEDAMALIQQKQEADKPIHQWGDIAVLKGRYGAYIRTPQGNYQIAKTVDPESLTEEQVREIMAKNEPLRPAKTGFRRKSAK